MTSTFYQKVLEDELSRRCKQNARYSLRAFAKSLKVDAAGLSKILSGQRPISLKMAHEISRKLLINSTQKKQFIKSAILERKSLSNALILKKIEEDVIFRDIDSNHYHSICDWYHNAILELSLTEGFKSNHHYIAKILGISIIESKLAVKRLCELGLLLNKNGILKKSYINLTTDKREQTSAALQSHQKQLLEKAIYSLENDSIEKRNHTGMTMSIDPKKIPAAKKLIGQFEKELCSLLESGKKQNVYQLTISLFSLQKKES